MDNRRRGSTYERAYSYSRQRQFNALSQEKLKRRKRKRFIRKCVLLVCMLLIIAFIGVLAVRLVGLAIDSFSRKCRKKREIKTERRKIEKKKSVPIERHS